MFDVDGTLVDSNYPHILAWSRALRSCAEWAPMNAIHRLIGMGGARLPCIAVESGGFSAGELRDAGAVAVAVYPDVNALREELWSGPLAQLRPRTDATFGTPWWQCQRITACTTAPRRSARRAAIHG